MALDRACQDFDMMCKGTVRLMRHGDTCAMRVDPSAPDMDDPGPRENDYGAPP
jgi:hypothetical protein